MKSKKVRVGGTIRLPFTTGVPVNAVVGLMGPFSQAGFWIELGGEAKADCTARDDTGEGMCLMTEDSPGPTWSGRR